MKIAGHVIQFGQRAGNTTLECTCGTVLATVDSDEREATTKAYKIGRCNIRRHFDNPSEKIDAATDQVAA